MTIASDAGVRQDWRRRIRAELFWIVLVKLAALTLLWMLFFSAPHQVRVDGEALSHRLGVAPADAPPRSAPMHEGDLSWLTSR